MHFIEYIFLLILGMIISMVIIEIFENKGRDVYPLLAQMRKHFKAYKYICHLHTKKSKEILEQIYI